MNRVYLRYSSDSQDSASQVHMIEKWLVAYGSGEVVRYEDKGVQGDKERPELARLLEEMRKGDTVVCFALDRISREGIVGTLQTVQKFATMGVRLVSVSEPWIDSENPCNEVVIAVLAWAAQQEKKRIKARQTAGIAAAKAEGKKWGGRPKGTVVKSTPAAVATIKKMKEEGMPVAEIAKVVKMSRQMVYTILKDA